MQIFNFIIRMYIIKNDHYDECRFHPFFVPQDKQQIADSELLQFQFAREIKFSTECKFQILHYNNGC